MAGAPSSVHYRFVELRNHRVFHRAAAPSDRPAILLLHGYTHGVTDTSRIAPEYFRTRRPPLLATWGRNDAIFPPAGATAEIGAAIRGFLDRRIALKS